MPTIRTPITAVDAIQRIPVHCWIGPFDNRNGFPNYPVWCDPAGQPVATLDAATHALWDGAFGGNTAALLEAIGQNPTKVPADTSTLTREELFTLYGLVSDHLQAQEEPV